MQAKCGIKSPDRCGPGFGLQSAELELMLSASLIQHVKSHCSGVRHPSTRAGYGDGVIPGPRVSPNRNFHGGGP